jgi:hypothetical protein
MAYIKTVPKKWFPKWIKKISKRNFPKKGKIFPKKRTMIPWVKIVPMEKTQNLNLFKKLFFDILVFPKKPILSQALF